MVGNTGEDVREPSLGIDGVELGCFDQGLGDSSGFATPFRAHKQMILPSKGDGAHGSFAGNVASNGRKMRNRKTNAPPVENKIPGTVIKKLSVIRIILRSFICRIVGFPFRFDNGL